MRQAVELVVDTAPMPLAKTTRAWKSRCFAICTEATVGTKERSEIPRRSSGPVVRPCVLSEARLLRLYTAAPHAAWRHDVDLSLSAAQQMARFAELAGVQTTFYLMPRSDWYNLFSREGARTLDVIAECGHRLGLHCDHREGSVVATVEADFALVEVAYPVFSPGSSRFTRRHRVCYGATSNRLRIPTRASGKAGTCLTPGPSGPRKKRRWWVMICRSRSTPSTGLRRELTRSSSAKSRRS